MLHSNKRQTEALTRLLTRALESHAHVTRARRAEGDDSSRWETVHITTREGSAPAVLVPVPAGAGYPQDVREALNRLPSLGRGEVPVIVSRRMSPGARKILSDERLAWADEAGNIRLSVGSVVVAVDAPPIPAREPDRHTEMPWSEASGAVAELLLGRAARDRTSARLDAVTALAEDLHVSAPLVSRTLQHFDALGWTERSGPPRGPQVSRHLATPGAMLSSWAAWHSSRQRRTTVAHGLIPDPDAWLRQLEGSWPRGAWAVTGEAAAQIRAPYLSRVSVVELYIEPNAYDDDLDDLMRRAALEHVAAGGRVRLLRGDPHLGALIADNSKEDDLPLVPDVRLYADLLAGGVRGDEAAAELRDRRIGF